MAIWADKEPLFFFVFFTLSNFFQQLNNFSQQKNEKR